MSSGPKLPLRAAKNLAAKLVERLAVGCTRIEIAGSIRRRRPEVGDIELVMVPRMVPGAKKDFFGPPQSISMLDVVLETLEAEGRLVEHPTKPANGDKYKKRWAKAAGVQVDLFIVTPPAEFGPIYAIRTGSADYSQRAVTALRGQGLRCEGGQVWRDNEVIPCPDEETFFRLAGMELVPPESRT